MSVFRTLVKKYEEECGEINKRRQDNNELPVDIKELHMKNKLIKTEIHNFQKMLVSISHYFL